MKLYENTPDEITEDTVLRRSFSDTVVRKINKEERTIDFIISTESVDRYKDIVEVKGWDLKNYKRNPVVLFGHCSSIPPIGKALKVWKEDGALKATAEFMPQDISQFAHSIFRMYEEGFLRAVSVGFRALKWEWIKDEDGNDTYGMRFLKSELLEFSAVPVPANPEALIAARSKGIDTLPFKSWAEELLDNWNVTGDTATKLYGIDRKEMETIRRRAAGAGATFRVPLDIQDQLMKKNLEAIRRAKAEKTAEKASVTLRDIEFDLPRASEANVKRAGTVEIATEEINGVKTYTIEKSDDFALFAQELVDSDVGDFMTLELRNEDSEEGADLVLTMKGSTSTIEYDLVGITEEGTLLGVKMSETEVAPAGVVETPAAEAGDDTGVIDEEKGKKPKAEDDDESDEDEDEDEDEKAAKPESKTPAEDDEEDEKAAPKAVNKDAADEDDDKMDFPTTLSFIENSLSALEDSLEETKSNKELTPSRHTMRKAKFLASYMRELADALDGGTSTVENKSTSKVRTPAGEEQDEGMTVDEATNHIKAIADQIQPLLTDLIAQKVNKLKGRLD